MEMITSLVLLAVGFVLLVKGADWFVDGSAGIAARLGIPQLVIGLTIVAMGTSAPEAAVSITAGSKTKETSAYTPFRNVFYGASTTKPALDSAAIRALTPTGKAYAAGTLTLNVPAGAQRVVIACDATKAGVTKVINQTAMNADVTATFAKSTVPVEGAEGYTAINYNVWVFEPAVPYENTATLVVTLG